MVKNNRRKICWEKFATRPTPLLERYLRMWGIVKEFKKFKSTNINNILVVSKNEVDDLYIDEFEHNNLPKFAYQEFKIKQSQKVLYELKKAVKDILDSVNAFEKIEIDEDNFENVFRSFIHYHGLGWAVVWYYHTCNRIFPEKIKKELLKFDINQSPEELLAILFTPTSTNPDFSVYYKTNRKDLLKKEKILGKIKLSQDTKRMVEHMTTISYLHEVADRLCSHFFEIFLKRIQNKTKINLKDIGQYSPRELKKLFLSRKKLSKNTIKDRKKLYVLKFQYGKTSLTFDDKAKQIISKLKEIDIERVSVLKGQVASSGRAEGRVVILRSIKDMGKVISGNIIVSPMTTPRMLPAAKKAYAIVTDEGGITCHAAIISRELNIPCIIRTKIATKVLKDGDLVEVDANRGIVKILKRK